jgi:hypothetical protein
LEARVVPERIEHWSSRSSAGVSGTREASAPSDGIDNKRNQLFERSLVSAAPLAEQLRDLLSRGRGRRHTACSTPQILTRSRDFCSLTASLQYLAQSWWVLSGISALGDRTFIPVRKNRRGGPMSQPEKENYGNNF